LTQEKNYAQGSRFNPQIFVSFFNELATERKNYAHTSVSFFNELATEKKTMLIASVSFFNELDRFFKVKNYAHELSLIMASKRTML
jgi:hypothetical protein